MKKAFLDSLAGMNVKEASRQCVALGYEVQEYPHGVASIMLLMPNTVKLWLNKDAATVRTATLGDSAELED